MCLCDCSACSHQQKPERLILGSERRRATQLLPIGGERTHSSVIIFHSSIIAQSARDAIAIAARAGGSRGRLDRLFSNAPLQRAMSVGTLVKGWVGRTTGSAGFGIRIGRCNTDHMRRLSEWHVFITRLCNTGCVRYRDTSSRGRRAVRAQPK